MCVRVLLPYIYLFTTKFRVLLCCPVFPTVSRISCNQFALLFFCPSLRYARWIDCLWPWHWTTVRASLINRHHHHHHLHAAIRPSWFGWYKSYQVSHLHLLYPPFAFLHYTTTQRPSCWGWTAVSVWWTVTLTTGVPTTDIVSCSFFLLSLLRCRVIPHLLPHVCPSKIWGKNNFDSIQCRILSSLDYTWQGRSKSVIISHAEKEIPAVVVLAHSSSFSFIP